jgi:hypothetical protein
MRFILLLSVLFAIGNPSAQETPGLKLKVSLAFPSISTLGFGMHGSLLTGQEHSLWRYGGQILHDEEFILFTSPANSVTAMHLLVGQEWSQTGAFSLTTFQGFGIAQTTRRKELIEQRFLGATYASRKDLGPSLTIGVNGGVSWQRNLGISLNVGTVIGRLPTMFTSLQADVGSW